MTCLRRLFRIKCKNKIPDTEVLSRADFSSSHILLPKAQLRWACHVARMLDHRLQKQLLYGERCWGSSEKRNKDSLNASLKAFDIEVDSWQPDAQDSQQWRSQITNGARRAESRRTTAAQQKRATRKACAASTSLQAPTVRGRLFGARIGLITHLRTHRSSGSEVKERGG